MKFVDRISLDSTHFPLLTESRMVRSEDDIVLKRGQTFSSSGHYHYYVHYMTPQLFPPPTFTAIQHAICLANSRDLIVFLIIAPEISLI